MQSLSEGSETSARELLLSFARTTLFCTLIGMILWLLDLAEPVWAGFFISFAIGYSLNTASILLHPRLLRHLHPLLATGLTTIAGLGTGLLIGGYVLTGDGSVFFFDDDYSTIILGLFFGVLGIVYFTTQEQLKGTRAELADARAERLNVEKQHLETQLKLLQAQIEPHFLFNTLSNVVGMIRDQPETAEKTLLDLTTLLRASLKRTRTEETTLGDELAIVSALLEINRIRMGGRLKWSIVGDESLNALPLPPMLLQPLVENAVKHGIEPLEEGGTITIRLRSEDERLIISIEDTGIGPGGPGPESTGVGVANVQSRLAALYDTKHSKRAMLTLTENDPQGMIATLSLPV